MLSGCLDFFAFKAGGQGGNFFPLSQWEGPRCLAFFTFKFLKGEVEEFFKIIPGSQCVPTMFQLSSQWVPIMFPICPQQVLHSTSFLSHMLREMLPSFHQYTWCEGEELYTSQQNLLF
jgi:hypothetical protein